MSAKNITKADIKAFVEAAHSDLDTVKVMLSVEPGLLDLPNGNETALGAACQTKREDIVTFLLAQGAPLDIYAACVLGLTERVAAFLDADPTLLNAKNTHSYGKRPLTFASEQLDVLALLKGRGSA